MLRLRLSVLKPRDRSVRKWNANVLRRKHKFESGGPYEIIGCSGGMEVKVCVRFRRRRRRGRNSQAKMGIGCDRNVYCRNGRTRLELVGLVGFRNGFCA